MREEGTAIDENRLYGNALSSMPMTFNMFGPLAMDLDLATRVFKALFSDFISKVEGFQLEHSPVRRFLASLMTAVLAMRDCEICLPEDNG